MLNILRMDLYRLIRAKSFWIGLIISLAFLSTAVFSTWFVTSPEYSQMVQDAGESGVIIEFDSNNQEMVAAQEEMESFKQVLSEMDILQYLGELLIGGNLLPLMIILIFTLFMVGDFETGFAKNIFTSKENRLGYVGSKAIVALLITAIYLVVNALFVLGLSSIFGVGPASNASSFIDIVVWVLLVHLVSLAYAMMMSFIMWMFRSKVAAVLACILTTAGMISSFIEGILSLFPSISFLSNYTLFAQFTSLSQGMSGLEGGDIIRIACTAIVYLVLFTGAGIMALRKKDI